MANSTEQLAAPRYPQVRITCRDCGMQHRAIVCPICEIATPSFAVFKGGKKSPPKLALIQGGAK